MRIDFLQLPLKLLLINCFMYRGLSRDALLSQTVNNEAANEELSSTGSHIVTDFQDLDVFF